MAQLLRSWQDAASNLLYSVSYQSGSPRQILTSVTPADPAYPVGAGGNPPTDGQTDGSILLRVCEGLDQVTITASSVSPYAVISVLLNAPACDLSTLAVVRATGFAAVAPATTGRGEVLVSGGTAPYSVTVAAVNYSVTVTADGTGLAAFPNLAAGSYSVTVADAAAPPSNRTASFVVPVLLVNGCPLPGALNYNPSATANDGSCIFVAVDAQPAGLVAAHLPVSVLMRAAPILAQPGIVYLYIETASTAAGPWLLVGQLRQGADPVTATVAFNVSEVLKAQFVSIAPPVEAGTDPSLSVLVRLRYVVQSALGVPTYAGTLTPFRALNAAVTPPVDGILTTPTPYTVQPIGAALWRNTATLTSGVVAEVLTVPATGCPARCFVWLNRAGGWQTGFFTGRHVHATDQADAVMFRDQSGSDRYARRGIVRPTLQVYSDKLTYDTYYALRGVRDSIQVYERTGAGQYVAVLVSSGTYNEYQEQTDKTYTVDFTISYPPVLVQTQ